MLSVSCSQGDEDPPLQSGWPLSTRMGSGHRGLKTMKLWAKINPPPFKLFVSAILATAYARVINVLPKQLLQTGVLGMSCFYTNLPSQRCDLLRLSHSQWLIWNNSLAWSMGLKLSKGSLHRLKCKGTLAAAHRVNTGEGSHLGLAV